MYTMLWDQSSKGRCQHEGRKQSLTNTNCAEENTCHLYQNCQSICGYMRQALNWLNDERKTKRIDTLEPLQKWWTHLTNHFESKAKCVYTIIRCGHSWRMKHGLFFWLNEMPSLRLSVERLSFDLKAPPRGDLCFSTPGTKSSIKYLTATSKPLSFGVSWCSIKDWTWLNLVGFQWYEHFTQNHSDPCLHLNLMRLSGWMCLCSCHNCQSNK